MRNLRYIGFIAILLVLCRPGWSQDSAAFSLTDRGGFVRTTSGAADDASVGYARLTSRDGKSVPSGLAIFGLRQNGILVTETAVAASPLITNGRIYAEVKGASRTGLAIANPNSQTVAISFFFTNQQGTNCGTGSTTIPANGQIARFLDESPFSGGSTIEGTFTFTSSLPVGATALQGFTNERSEFLITTLPVADLDSTPTGEIVFPHFADGGGWTTEVILANPSDFTIAGTLQFSDRITVSSLPNSISTSLELNTFNYSLPPRSARKFVSGGQGVPARTGWVRIRPRLGSVTPSAVVIFSFRQEGITVTEAGVASVPRSSAFRVYAETDGDFESGDAGSIQTGVAVANTSDESVTVTLDLTTLDGQPTGATGSLVVPPQSQVARFLYQIEGLDDLGSEFQGVLRVVSSGPEISLAGRFNERQEFIVSTTAPVTENSEMGTELVFPHLVDGGGFVTQFVLFNSGNNVSSPLLTFRQPDGNALNLRLLGEGAMPSLLELASFSGTPGETLIVRGNDFDPDVLTFVIFEKHPQVMLMPATSVSETEVTVKVPFLIDVDLLAFGSGLASVSVRQEFPGGSAVYGPTDGFFVGALPGADGPVGQLTLKLLDDTLARLDLVSDRWIQIEQASNGLVDASPLKSANADLTEILSRYRTWIQQVVTGQLTSRGIGSLGGQDLYIDLQS